MSRIERIDRGDEEAHRRTPDRLDSRNNLLIYAIFPNMVIFGVHNIWRFFRAETSFGSDEVRSEQLISPIE